MSAQMLCLSLWQPWASSIFCFDCEGVQIKKDETRHWPTNVRGRIAIHAAKSTKGREMMPEEDLHASLSWRDNTVLGLAPMPLGCILGTVEIVACHRTQDIAPRRSEAQLLWGDYRQFGENGKQRYAFELANPVALREPIPYRGEQGFFSVPADVWQTLGAAVRAEGNLSLFGGNE
jgi:hypothetical protein